MARKKAEKIIDPILGEPRTHFGLPAQGVITVLGLAGVIFVVWSHYWGIVLPVLIFTLTGLAAAIDPQYVRLFLLSFMQRSHYDGD